MKDEILLGDTVEDIHTGFRGVAICRSMFINKCVQFDVAPKVDKDNKVPDSQGIDEGSLKVIEKGPLHSEEEIEGESSGGPNSKGRKMRGW